MRLRGVKRRSIQDKTLQTIYIHDLDASPLPTMMKKNQVLIMHLVLLLLITTAGENCY